MLCILDAFVKITIPKWTEEEAKGLVRRLWDGTLTNDEVNLIVKKGYGLARPIQNVRDGIYDQNLRDMMKLIRPHFQQLSNKQKKLLVEMADGAEKSEKDVRKEGDWFQRFVQENWLEHRQGVCYYVDNAYVSNTVMSLNNENQNDTNDNAEQ